MGEPVIGIIGGKGRMGRLFKDFFKDRGIRVHVSDIGTSLSNIELVEKSDIIMVSVPIDVTEKVIKEILPYIPKHKALMDFTSVKTMPVKAMMKGRCEVLGMHPMFGDSNPISGQTVILCPTRKSGKWANWISEFLKDNGAIIQIMTAKEHDKLMSTAQGLIHFADISFANALRMTKTPMDQLLKFTSKASELKVQLAARLISQDPGLYGNIQMGNPNTVKAIKQYKKSVDELLKVVKKKDLSKFKQIFNKNKDYYGKYTHDAYKDSSYLIDMFQEHECTKLRKKAAIKPSKDSIAVLGPRNTYSHIALRKYREIEGPKLKGYLAKDLSQVFDLVEKGKVDRGIVPLENSINGSVREVIDALFHHNVYFEGSINMPINHSLVSFSHAKEKDIKQVYSHPQALAQCRKFLQKNLPKAEINGVTSTSAALEKLINSRSKFIAVIAPEGAAKEEKLNILRKGIEDGKGNSTVFVVIKRGKFIPDDQKSYTKTSIAFNFKKDSPGSLFTVFQDFAKAKINLTRIESRPTKSKFGDYIFYLDFEGTPVDPNTAKTLKLIGGKVVNLKILGCYT